MPTENKPAEPFQREERYIVIKRSDIERLSPGDRRVRRRKIPGRRRANQETSNAKGQRQGNEKPDGILRRPTGPARNDPAAACPPIPDLVQGRAGTCQQGEGPAQRNLELRPGYRLYRARQPLRMNQGL
jgi:hypothetical protein